MNKNHLSKFLELNFRQGPVGVAPYEWAHTYLKGHMSQQPLKGLLNHLPNKKLQRNEVYQICASDCDVLLGYLCVMAWGNKVGRAQGIRPRRGRVHIPSVSCSLKFVEGCQGLFLTTALRIMGDPNFGESAPHFSLS